MRRKCPFIRADAASITERIFQRTSAPRSPLARHPCVQGMEDRNNLQQDAALGMGTQGPSVGEGEFFPLLQRPSDSYQGFWGIDLNGEVV